jgi:transglutaminase-like putative cysteine protease
LKTVSFQYQTELVFSSPACEHRFILRILPKSDGRQSIRKLSWHIDPQAVVWRTSDSFGNDALAGFIDAPHTHFRFGIQAAAEVTDAPFTLPRGEFSQRRGDAEEFSGLLPYVLLYPTELTRVHSGLVNFYNDIERSAPQDTLSRVQYFSHAVHTHLRYERGVTVNSTPAQEAFDGGVGVCQDYAHILLALLRKGGVPCRYVAGLASDYGETHAWVEAWITDRYYGIDPTRDKLIDEGYIALSRGRDFEDCSVERGVFKGACRGTQTINLSMEISQ